VGIRSWWVGRKNARRSNVTSPSITSNPLREFVYLDEVSLRSLLASQLGALPSEIVEVLARADEAEINSKLGASSPIISAQVGSRFQVSNSQSVQTTRQTIAQSLFKQFRELPETTVLLQPREGATNASSIHELVLRHPPLAVSESSIKRGSLIEVEVELVADPIFRFSTIISEVMEMNDLFPQILGGAQLTGDMAEVRPINNVLQRMLVGLIPLRAKALNLVSAQHDGQTYLMDRDAARELGLAAQDVYIVGVTEHSSYWRDVRRVLFSRAQFTLLCRIARDGFHDSWAPVKLTDVLGEISPDFPDAIASITRGGFGSHIAPEEHDQQQALILALCQFADRALTASNSIRPPDDVTRIVSLIWAMKPSAESIGSQRAAYRAVKEALASEFAVDFAQDEWDAMWNLARADSNLMLFKDFPSPIASAKQEVLEADLLTVEPEVLIDTEIIAIYW